MAKQKYYVQCRMRKPNPEGGYLFQVSWLPEKYATIGKILKLKKDDTWVNGWEVISIWGKRTAEEVRERSQDYKHHRKASDI